jgi:general secretion pathway protein K
MLIVMVAIFVLSVLVGAFAYSMKVETKLAMNADRETKDFWEASGISGVEAAKWILAMSRSLPNHNENQKWAGGAGDEFETNGVLADVSLEPFRVGDQTFPFSIKIRDMERKANINTANQNLLEQALTLAGADAGEIPAIAGAILDWIDRDDVLNANGAESDYYQGLNPPYYAKNAAIDDLSELLLVRGVTPEIYWGSKAADVADLPPTDRYGRPIEGFTHPGLVDLFTPLSSGKLNIEFVSADVLQMIPGLDENTAAMIIEQRTLAPFRNLGEVNIPPNLRPALTALGDVRSSTFEVEVTVEGSSRKFYAVLRLTQNDVKTLVFKELN